MTMCNDAATLTTRPQVGTSRSNQGGVDEESAATGTRAKAAEPAKNNGAQALVRLENAKRATGGAARLQSGRARVDVGVASLDVGGQATADAVGIAARRHKRMAISSTLDVRFAASLSLARSLSHAHARGRGMVWWGGLISGWLCPTTSEQPKPVGALSRQALVSSRELWRWFQVRCHV